MRMVLSTRRCNAIIQSVLQIMLWSFHRDCAPVSRVRHVQLVQWEFEYKMKAKQAMVNAQW
jgi:hypothetical protein